MEIDLGDDKTINCNRLQTRNTTESTSTTSGAERLQMLLARGTGHKRLDDDLFAAVDGSLKVYRRQGIFEIEEQLVEPEWVLSRQKKFESFYIINILIFNFFSSPEEPTASVAA